MAGHDCRCPWCGAKNALSTAPSELGEEYHTVKCAACGCSDTISSPLPEHIHAPSCGCPRDWVEYDYAMQEAERKREEKVRRHGCFGGWVCGNPNCMDCDERNECRDAWVEEREKVKP